MKNNKKAKYIKMPRMKLILFLISAISVFSFYNPKMTTYVEEEKEILDKLPQVTLPEKGRFRYIQFRVGDRYYVRGNDYWDETLYIIRDIRGEFKKLGLKKTNFNQICAGEIELNPEKKTITIYGDEVESNLYDEEQEKTAEILRKHYEGFDVKYDPTVKVPAVWLEKLRKRHESA